MEGTAQRVMEVNSSGKIADCIDYLQVFVVITDIVLSIKQAWTNCK